MYQKNAEAGQECAQLMEDHIGWRSIARSLSIEGMTLDIGNRNGALSYVWEISYVHSSLTNS
jgi:hypothetical protein